jgi:hypothetical protein
MGDSLYRPYCSKIGTRFNGNPWPGQRLLTFAFKFPIFFSLLSLFRLISLQATRFTPYQHTGHISRRCMLRRTDSINRVGIFCIVVGVGRVRFRLVCRR